MPLATGGTAGNGSSVHASVSTTVVSTVVAVGPATGTLATCSCGDHSVTAMSVPGETTKNTSNNSHAGSDVNGSYPLPIDVKLSGT